MESRLHEPPLGGPLFPVAGEQAVAEHRPELGHQPGLAIVAVIALQHMLDLLGPVEQERSCRPQPYGNERAILPADVQEERDRRA